MLVSAAPVWSLILVMWYSDGPGYDWNCQPNSEPQNSRPCAVSSAGISMCTISPGIYALLSNGRPAELPAPPSSFDRPRGRKELIGAGAGRARGVRDGRDVLHKTPQTAHG